MPFSTALSGIQVLCLDCDLINESEHFGPLIGVLPITLQATMLESLFQSNSD